MQTYYVSFTLAENAGYPERYEALMDLLRSYDKNIWWAETTSYVLFRTDKGTTSIVSDIKRAVDVTTDIVVLGSPHIKAMHVIGANTDSDIYELVDFAKKA